MLCDFYPINYVGYWIATYIPEAVLFILIIAFISDELIEVISSFSFSIKKTHYKILSFVYIQKTHMDSTFPVFGTLLML
jgi:hypothetical protein